MFNPEKLLGGLICGGMRRKSEPACLSSDGALGGLIGTAVESVRRFSCRENGVSSAALEKDEEPLSLATQAEAVLLIRAMIAAAYAGGPIDASERAVIFDKLKAFDLSEEEQEFIASELLAAKNCKSLATAVSSPEVAREVYLVSALAVEMDTEAQRAHMQELAGELALDPAEVNRLHQQIDLSLPA